MKKYKSAWWALAITIFLMVADFLRELYARSLGQEYNFQFWGYGMMLFIPLSIYLIQRFDLGKDMDLD